MDFFVIWLFVFIIAGLAWLIALCIEVSLYAEDQTEKNARAVVDILKRWWWPLLWPVILIQYVYLFGVYLTDALRKTS